MDTEAMAREIVRIKNRLEELEEQVEGAGDADVEDERKELHDRMRHLQDQLSTQGSGKRGEQDDPGAPENVHYVPPA